MKQFNHVCVNTRFKHLSRLTDSGSPFSEHLDSKSHSDEGDTQHLTPPSWFRD